jgi:spoIIIJ-associated protein
VRRRNHIPDPRGAWTVRIRSKEDPVVSQGENTPTVTSDDVADLPLVAGAEDNSKPIDGEAALEIRRDGPDDLDKPDDDLPDDLDDPADLELEDLESEGPESADLESADLESEASAPGEGEDLTSGPGEDIGDGRPESADPADLEQESEIAADYVEGLLDVADLDGDIDMDVEGDRALVSVVGATLQELIGPRGEVLEALQELTRLAVHRQTGMRTRIMLDVGGYRLRRRSELAELGRDAAEEVRTSGVPKRLAVMTPFEQ